MSMHNDLNLLEGVFMKNFEKYAISDLTYTASHLFKNIENLDKIAAYLDVYYKHYVSKMVYDVTSVMKNQARVVEQWNRILSLIKDRIYVSLVSENIFEFVKLMDDESTRDNSILMMQELKKSVSLSDVGLVDLD